MDATYEHDSEHTIKVCFQGDMDELCASTLFRVEKALKKNVIFDFKDVLSLNSSGIKNWLLFFRRIEAGRKISFSHCTSEVINTMTMLPSFLVNANINLLYLRFICESCQDIQHQTVDFKGLDLSDLNVPECKSCRSTMELISEEDIEFLIAMVQEKNHSA